MVGVSSVGCVSDGGWCRILCWVSLCRERKKHTGVVGQACWVQEYTSTVVQIDWPARWKVV